MIFDLLGSPNPRLLKDPHRDLVDVMTAEDAHALEKALIFVVRK